MAKQFGYEKLRVFQKGIEFVTARKALLERLPRRVSACEQLERASESVIVNIAHASSSWLPKERAAYLEYANGSALECAACLDVLVAKGLLPGGDVTAGKALLREVVSMLMRMREVANDRMREEEAPYQSESARGFSHEGLDVYGAEMEFISWLEDVSPIFECSANLLTKIDRSATSIALNTAEGNGRFSDKDRARFLGVAYKATVQSAALLDLAAAESSVPSSQVQPGRDLLRRIGAMLAGLAKKVRDDTQ